VVHHVSASRGDAEDVAPAAGCDLEVSVDAGENLTLDVDRREDLAVTTTREGYEHEPLDPARLHGVPGLLATPHSAFYSEAALTRVTDQGSHPGRQVLTGEAPDYQVN
jgi:lactate dehydrogenase-like 2-hydroxyacid dehydrogenase